MGAAGTVIAQSGSAAAEVLPIVAILLVIVIAGAVAILSLRKRVLGGQDSGEIDTGGVMDELRRLRDSGEMTEQQFEEARLKMAAKATGMPLEELRRKAIERAGGRVAAPGVDLTGRPLPGSTSVASSGDDPVRTEADVDDLSGEDAGSVG